MKLPDTELSPEAHQAIIACLRIAAARGRQLRLERERAAQAQNAQNGMPVGEREILKAGKETGEPADNRAD